MSRFEQSSETARQIYQDLLDRIAAAYSANDFAAFAAVVQVPHLVSSFGPSIPINTRDDLRVMFDGVRLYMEKEHITTYSRSCLAADFKADDVIEGMHETRLMCGVQLVEQPYPVKSVLRLIDGTWLVSQSDNALHPDKGLGRAMQRSDRSTSPE